MARETSPTAILNNTPAFKGARRRLSDIPGARGALAALLLVVGVGAVLAAADAGPLRLGAGDMDILLARGDSGYTMSVSARSCPPKCGFDLDWRIDG